MRRILTVALMTFAWLTIVPAAAYAQASITGVVKDTSGTVFQNMPGPEIAANYNAPNAVIRPSLGRDLSAGANQNVPVNLVEPGTMYGERRNQVDLRFGKILRVGRTRTTLSLDLYNAFNGSPVLTENSAFAMWRTPTQILTARFAKIGAQIEF